MISPVNVLKSAGNSAQIRRNFIFVQWILQPNSKELCGANGLFPEIICSQILPLVYLKNLKVEQYLYNIFPLFLR